MPVEYFGFKRACSVVMIICLVFVVGFLVSCTTHSPSIPQVSSTVPPQQYLLKASIIPDLAGEITPAGNAFDADTKIDITAIPASGYQFDYWEGDASGTSNTFSIVMDQNKNVIGHFKAIPVHAEQLSLKTFVDPPGAGVITPESNIYKYGTAVAVNAQPLPGFRFNFWDGDIVSNSSSINVTMESNKTITAHFKSLYSLDISVLPNGSGSTTPSSGFYENRDTVTVTAISATGYEFDHWSGDVENNDNPQSLLMDKNRKLVANFNPTEVDIQEGIDKNLIGVIAVGSDYLNKITVKFTSYCKTSISVDVPASTIFKAVRIERNCSRLVTLEKTSVYLGPGAVKELSFNVVCFDMLLKIPDRYTDLVPTSMTLPDDLKLLLATSSFKSAIFRIKQYSVWVITDSRNSIKDVKIGQENNYQPPSKEELNQIKKMYQEAGISTDKYSVIN